METLEKEFGRAMSEHKHNVLKWMIADYYITMGKDRQAVKRLVNSHIIKLLLLDDGLERFNSLYEKGYVELAQLLPELDEGRLYVRL